MIQSKANFKASRRNGVIRTVISGHEQFKTESCDLNLIWQRKQAPVNCIDENPKSFQFGCAGVTINCHGKGFNELSLNMVSWLLLLSLYLTTHGTHASCPPTIDDDDDEESLFLHEFHVDDDDDGAPYDIAGFGKLTTTGRVGIRPGGPARPPLGPLVPRPAFEGGGGGAFDSRPSPPSPGGGGGGKGEAAATSALLAIALAFALNKEASE